MPLPMGCVRAVSAKINRLQVLLLRLSITSFHFLLKRSVLSFFSRINFLPLRKNSTANDYLPVFHISVKVNPLTVELTHSAHPVSGVSSACASVASGAWRSLSGSSTRTPTSCAP
jgi:hypothetical protein